MKHTRLYLLSGNHQAPVNMFDGYRYIIVGSGLTGAVLAERVAAGLDQPVLVLERRGHVGGNAYSSVDPETGIECHWYGSHIFHTRHRHVWEYVNRFACFTQYRHRVLTEYQGNVYSMPISLDTINRFYGLSLKPAQALEFIRGEAARAGLGKPRNLEEQAIALIGRPLYEAFIKGYTIKQWNRDPRDLPPEIITRLPVRTSYNTDYFSDPYQGIPEDGYGAMLERLLDHPRIDLRLKTEFTPDMLADVQVPVFHTGMIDAFFGYALGELAWRSLRFEFETHDVADHQGISVMNYAEAAVPFTRVHEFKHYHPEREAAFRSGRTIICREYPQDFSRETEPYYPVNDAASQHLHGAYAARAARQGGIRFCGRLGAYCYLDMDAAIKEALDLFEREIRRSPDSS